MSSEPLPPGQHTGWLLLATRHSVLGSSRTRTTTAQCTFHSARPFPRTAPYRLGRVAILLAQLLLHLFAWWLTIKRATHALWVSTTRRLIPSMHWIQLVSVHTVCCHGIVCVVMSQLISLLPVQLMCVCVSVCVHACVRVCVWERKWYAGLKVHSTIGTQFSPNTGVPNWHVFYTARVAGNIIM